MRAAQRSTSTQRFSALMFFVISFLLALPPNEAKGEQPRGGNAQLPPVVGPVSSQPGDATGSQTQEPAPQSGATERIDKMPMHLFRSKDGKPILTNQPEKYSSNPDYVEVAIKYEPISDPSHPALVSEPRDNKPRFRSDLVFVVVAVLLVASIVTARHFLAHKKHPKTPVTPQMLRFRAVRKIGWLCVVCVVFLGLAMLDAFNDSDPYDKNVMPLLFAEVAVILIVFGLLALRFWLNGTYPRPDRVAVDPTARVLNGETQIDPPTSDSGAKP